MKFRVCLKDPDGVSDALREAAINSLGKINGLSEGEHALLMEGREEFLQNFIKRWVEYNEYLTVEFDTDTSTAKVIENGK